MEDVEEMWMEEDYQEPRKTQEELQIRLGELDTLLEKFLKDYQDTKDMTAENLEHRIKVVEVLNKEFGSNTEYSEDMIGEILSQSLGSVSALFNERVSSYQQEHGGTHTDVDIQWEDKMFSHFDFSASAWFMYSAAPVSMLILNSKVKSSHDMLDYSLFLMEGLAWVASPFCGAVFFHLLYFRKLLKDGWLPEIVVS